MSASEKQYECKDKSILLPHFRRLCWDPLGRYIPDHVAPNSMTLAGAVIAFFAFLTSLLIDPASHWLYLIPAALVCVYTSLDNMDGAHARRTGQCSPLGEFMDHWLDTLNGGFIGWGVAHAIGLPEHVIIPMVSSVVLAVFATYWEQKITGVIHMGYLGNLEGLVVVVAMFIGVAILGQETFCNTSVFGVASGLLFGAAYVVQALAIAVGCLWRVRRQWRIWVPFVAALVSVSAWFIAGDPSYMAAGLILVATHAVFSGRLLASRLLGAETPVAQYLVGAALPCACVASLALSLEAQAQKVLAYVLAAFLWAVVVYDFCRFVRGMRHHLQPRELLGRLFVGSPNHPGASG